MISNVNASLLVANQAINSEGNKVQKDLKSEKNDKNEKTEKAAELKKVDSLKQMISNGEYSIDIPVVSAKMADALLEGRKES